MAVVAVLVWGSRRWKLNYECHVKRVCELFQSNLDSKVRVRTVVVVGTVVNGDWVGRGRPVRMEVANQAKKCCRSNLDREEWSSVPRFVDYRILSSIFHFPLVVFHLRFSTCPLFTLPLMVFHLSPFSGLQPTVFHLSSFRSPPGPQNGFKRGLIEKEFD